MNFKRIVALVLCVILTVPMFTTVEGAQAEKPQYLVNTLYKLQNTSSLSVGYLGGSVTSGWNASDINMTSWRGLTRDWLQSNYRDKSIVEINAGASGTGSQFAVLRLGQHLFKNDGKAPDLTFIELCINDSYEKVYRTAANFVYIETIIQKIYRSNPKADIVFIITGDASTLIEDAESDTAVYGLPYRIMAEYYNIPVLYVGREIALTIKEEAGRFPGDSSDSAWRKYFTDGVHPNNEGHAHYARTIYKFLSENLMTGYKTTEADYQDKALPEVFLSTTNKYDRGEKTVEKMLDANAFGGYSFTDEQVAPFIKEEATVQYSPITSNAKGDTIQFNFTGANIALWANARGHSGDIRGTNISYSIDGGEAKTVNVYSGSSSTGSKLFILGTALDNKTAHTVKIEHLDDQPFTIYNMVVWNAEGTPNVTIGTDPTKIETPYEFPFTDVSDTAWYRADVEGAHKKGLIAGKTETTFVPGDNMTYAEAVKLAACMHQLYRENKVTLENGKSPWYSTYMKYALDNGLIAEDLTPTANEKITRRDFVKIFYAALPEKEYNGDNQVADNSIPDVKTNDDGCNQIYAFYRAGILTGSDESGTFNPESNIVRSEVAAILTRMFDKSARKSITLL